MTVDAQLDRRERFRGLHGQGLFVMPNAWDIGSARLLASLGFEAIAMHEYTEPKSVWVNVDAKLPVFYPR